MEIPGVTVSAGGIIVRTRILLITQLLTGRIGQSRVHYLGHEYVITDVSGAHRYDVIAHTPTRLYVSYMIQYIYACCQSLSKVFQL